MNKELEPLYKLLLGIEAKPGMYLMDNNFTGLGNYLFGYLVALEGSNRKEYNRDFSDWLASGSNAIAWPYYILWNMANNDEKLAFMLIICKLKEFIGQYK